MRDWAKKSMVGAGANLGRRRLLRSCPTRPLGFPRLEVFLVLPPRGLSTEHERGGLPELHERLMRGLLCLRLLGSSLGRRLRARPGEVASLRLLGAHSG